MFHSHIQCLANACAIDVLATVLSAHISHIVCIHCNIIASNLFFRVGDMNGTLSNTHLTNQNIAFCQLIDRFSLIRDSSLLHLSIQSRHHHFDA
jgi:hypothetical protein